MNVHRWLNVVIVCLTPSYCYGQSVSPPPPCEGAPKPISKRPIYEGATYSKIPLPDEYDGCAYFVTINPTTSIFRVLASGAEKHGSPRALYLGDYIGKENAVIAVSGGYMSSFSPPKALGLVKVNGRQISAPHTTWLGKGMVCTDGRLPKIANYDELKATSLSDCLQSGPLLIDGGKVRYPSSDIDVGEEKLVKSEQNQAFICVDTNHEIKLGVSDPIKLDAFSDFLKEKLNCKDALRLTGHFTAGLQIGRDLHGSDEYPLPTVIAVAPKAKR
jgi:uncharacterized protein YigE (DUF2233 family)